MYAFRAFAILVALSRGGLAVDFAKLGRARSIAFGAACLPYFAEVIGSAGAARAILPSSTGVGAGSPLIITFMAASLWSSLTASIVVPTMLDLIDAGSPLPAYVVSAAAPFEVATALLLFSVLNGVRLAEVAGDPLAEVFGLIPVQICGSAAWGAFLGVLFVAALRARSLPRVVAWLRSSPATHEPILLFMGILCGGYAVCGKRGIPVIIGYLMAPFFALTTAWLAPDAVPALLAQLKIIWSFAECFLFVFTGSVVYGAIQSRSAAFSGEFLAVLAIGSLARLGACTALGAAWGALVDAPGAAAAAQVPAAGARTPTTAARMPTAAAWTPTASAGAAVAAGAPAAELTKEAQTLPIWRRAIFLWTGLTPKATVQATLGPEMAAEAEALAITVATGAFVADSCAVAILVAALLGTYASRTVGAWSAREIQAHDSSVAAAAAAAASATNKVEGEGCVGTEGSDNIVARLEDDPSSVVLITSPLGRVAAAKAGLDGGFVATAQGGAAAVASWAPGRSALHRGVRGGSLSN